MAIAHGMMMNSLDDADFNSGTHSKAPTLIILVNLNNDVGPLRRMLCRVC